MTLQEDGILDKPVDQIDAKAVRTVMKLNRLFFTKRFGPFLAKEIPVSPYFDAVIMAPRTR